MSKTIDDLRDHLFAALDGLRSKEQPMEIDRAKAMKDDSLSPDERADRLAEIDHPYAAKRPPIDSGYFEAFNRDNVALIDVDEGFRMKRVRPAPMGRAYRVQKRTCHITIQLASAAGEE